MMIIHGLSGDPIQSKVKVVAILCFWNHTIGAKLFRGVVAIVPAYLAYMGETSLWSFLLHTSFGWEGGSSSLLDGSGWRRGAVAQGVAHFMLWSMMALGPAFDNSWIWGRSGGRSGVVRGVRSFGCIFSTCFHLCSLFVPSFIFFSCFLTNCHFFSFHVFLCSLHLTPSQIKPFWQNDCL